MPKNLGTNGVRESGNREQRGREIGESFIEAAMRAASKDITFFRNGVRDTILWRRKHMWKGREVWRVLSSLDAQII